MDNLNYLFQVVIVIGIAYILMIFFLFLKAKWKKEILLNIIF